MSIKNLISALKYKRAVKKANELARLFNIRFYVIYLNKKFKVVPKQTMKDLIKRHRFRKGTTIQDIEKRVLYITK